MVPFFWSISQKKKQKMEEIQANIRREEKELMEAVLNSRKGDILSPFTILKGENPEQTTNDEDIIFPKISGAKVRKMIKMIR